MFCTVAGTPNLHVYTHTFIVSLALKVRTQRVSVTQSNHRQLWQDCMTKISHQLTMNEAQIDELKYGLKFGKAVELPHEVMFSAHQMCDVLVEHETIQQFAQLRCVCLSNCRLRSLPACANS